MVSKDKWEREGAGHWVEGVVNGRREDADGDRPETSEAQGQRVPLTSPENRPRQKHLNP